MKRLAATVWLTTGCLVAAGTTAYAAPIGGMPISAEAARIDFVATRDHMTRAEAVSYLDRKNNRQESYQRIAAESATDGAYFDGETLTVMVNDATTAATVQAAGLTARTGLGENDLKNIVAAAAQVAGTSPGLVSLAPDLKGQRVVATVADNAPEALIGALEAMPHIVIEKGESARLTADVVPGRDMNGAGCTLGFPATGADGNNLLLTVGHCVVGSPKIYDEANNQIGQGVSSDFYPGIPSRDIGLVDLDPEDTGQPFIDTRGGVGNAVILGADKQPIGTDVCKTGRSTGWTCGVIQAYDVTVDYPARYPRFTRVSGLVQSSFCAREGDSGGPVLGTGNLAQGMVSGGSTGGTCTFNSGSPSTSFYQPLVDAASRYGVTLRTAQ
jgi:hypothetical protein